MANLTFIPHGVDGTPHSMLRRHGGNIYRGLHESAISLDVTCTASLLGSEIIHILIFGHLAKGTGRKLCKFRWTYFGQHSCQRAFQPAPLSDSELGALSDAKPASVPFDKLALLEGEPGFVSV